MSENKFELAQRIAAERRLAKTNRMFLAREVLGYDFTETTHSELFAQFPKFEEGKSWAEQFEKPDVMILWSRGHYKTTAVIVVCVQAILVNPDIRIILMQGSKINTQNLLAEIASHFNGEAQNSKLATLFPEYCGTRSQIKQKASAFTTPARKRGQLPQATCSVASPKTLKTGQHYDLGIFDDLINDQNYRNPKLLAKAQEDFDMCYPLIDPGCPRFVTGTRYAFGDLYEEIMRRDKGHDNWTISVKTCWNDNGGVRFPQQKARDGRTIGFTKEMLMKIMRDTPTIFATQYLNKPMLDSQQTLTQEMLDNAIIPNFMAPALSESVMFLDLAQTDTETADDCVILVGKVDLQSKMYAVDMRGAQWNTNTFAMNVLDMVLIHRPSKIMLEKSGAGTVFAEFLKVAGKSKGMNLPVDFIKVDNRADAKNIRVGALAGHIKAGRFKFFLGLPCWEKACEQAIQFPKGKNGHDDYPDTWALMAQYFSQGSLYMPVMSMQTTKHSIVAMMERDPVMQTIDSMGQEIECRDGVGVMGDSFSC